MSSFLKFFLKSCEAIVRELGTEYERAQRGKSRPPAVEVARGSGVGRTSPVPGGGVRDAGRERDNCGNVFAVLRLARSAHRARSSFRTESIICMCVSLALVRGSSRLAAPAAVLLPADVFNVCSQRWTKHKSFYGNFIPNAARSLACLGPSI